ncbi:uncharacterized protein PG998_009050 [Apiospora kogelbergensis]|uniref:uncharacterized protein n=1 Tax=Apiospora kogelbergensis TaxID=1337665 RepID=UPI00312E65BD
MRSNKDRLYIALYARGGTPTMPGLEDKYHWALIVGPKRESNASRGHRFHAMEKLSSVGSLPKAQSVWQYESLEIPMAPKSMLLVRIVVGKVKNMSRLRAILDATPVRPEWVREALQAAIRDGRALGASAGDWKSVRDTTMRFVERKKAAHRFDGSRSYDSTKAATWDMLTKTELVP